MIGQWGREFMDPTSQAAGFTAMTVAGVAGQAGPQVVLPEEVIIISVPTAYFTGLKVGGIKAALEIEAGYAYEEMVRAGVSSETAKDIALTVGAFNALLNVVELDELGKGIKALSKGGKSAGNSALFKVLTQFGINVGKETVVEVAQEGVTIAGVNAGKRIEGIETDSWGEITNRLWDTGTQSALSFGFFNLPGAIKGGLNTNLQGKGNVATAKVAEEVGENLIKEGTGSLKIMDGKVPVEDYNSIRNTSIKNPGSDQFNFIAAGCRFRYFRNFLVTLTSILFLTRIIRNIAMGYLAYWGRRILRSYPNNSLRRNRNTFLK